MKSFGDLLREFRSRANKSMGDCSRSLGVSVTFISDVERGTRAPFTKEKILKLSNYLDLSSTQVGQLLQASAQWRGVYELEVGASDAHNDTGLALLRGWNSLSTKQLEEIQNIVSRRRESGEFAMVEEN